MALDYTSYNNTIANLMVTTTTNAEYVQILPSIIDYAEQRIYRELDPLNTVVRDTSGFLTANIRNFMLPTSLGRFIVVDGINVITPTGYTVANGTRNPLQRVSQQLLDMAWPSTTAASSSDVPEQYAMVTDQLAIVGQPPGSNYNVEVVGTIRPIPLSSTNTTTYLSLYYPELLVAASLIFASAYMRNFGAQSDDPRMAVSWSSEYDKLFASANVELQRQRSAGPGWSSLSPNPVATPPRQ